MRNFQAPMIGRDLGGSGPTEMAAQGDRPNVGDWAWNKGGRYADVLPARTVNYQRPQQPLRGKALNMASKQAQLQALQKYQSKTPLPPSTSKGASLDNQRY